MALSVEQFIKGLDSRMPSVMLVHGDEPLQLREVVDAVRRAAPKHGFTERRRFVADADFSWGQLDEVASTMSLFADQQLVDISLEKLPTKGADAERLLNLIERAGETYSVILHGARLAAKDLKSAWAKAALSAGVEFLIWPPRADQLPGFIRQRLLAGGFQPDADAVTAMVERVEGNLLAADQEIYKLSLLREPGPLSAEDIQAAVADQSRFEIDDLVAAFAAGDRKRFFRVLVNLRDEDVNIVLVINALARETRAILGYKLNPKMPRFVTARWTQAKSRLPEAYWRRYLAQLGKLDGVSKGRGELSGDIWRDLMQSTQPMFNR